MLNRSYFPFSLMECRSAQYDISNSCYYGGGGGFEMYSGTSLGWTPRAGKSVHNSRVPTVVKLTMEYIGLYKGNSMDPSRSVRSGGMST